jgi:hypothetical protein
VSTALKPHHPEIWELDLGSLVADTNVAAAEAYLALSCSDLIGLPELLDAMQICA